jgi:LPS export ABC transporter protein LptC
VIRGKTIRGITLLAALAVLSVLVSRPSEEESAAPVKGLDTRLNYALHDFHGRLHNAEGAVRMEIDAPMLRNDASSGIGTVTAPNIRIQQDDEEWYITAESAVFAADREHVLLEGEVTLLRSNPLTGDRLDIKTRDVQLNITPRTASSDAVVRVRHGGDRLNARGMKLDMKSDRIELLDEVQAHYEVL